MNLLCIDIGNTSTSFSTVENNAIGDIHRIINDDESIELSTFGKKLKVFIRKQPQSPVSKVEIADRDPSLLSF